jgi:hypothetical protein
MEHDSHHDAHVHGLRLILGSILAPVRPSPSYALPCLDLLLARRSGPRRPRTRAPTQRLARRPRSTTGTIRGQ